MPSVCPGAFSRRMDLAKSQRVTRRREDLFMNRYLCILLVTCTSVFSASAQQIGGAGTIQGTVTDTTGAVVAGAKIELHNPITGFARTAETDTAGNFTLQNLPPNGYHLTVTQSGFQTLN